MKLVISKLNHVPHMEKDRYHRSKSTAPAPIMAGGRELDFVMNIEE